MRFKSTPKGIVPVADLLWKTKLFVRAMQVFRNWSTMYSVYKGSYSCDTALLETKEGVKMKIRSKSTDVHVLAEIFLLNEYPLDDIPAGSVILDVGSHIGLFAVYACAQNKKFKVFCFEPIKENFNLLEENIRINGYNDSVICINAALAGSSGKRTIYVHGDMAAHSMVKKSGNTTEIDTVALKDVFDTHGVTQCGYLKMDCEGAEYEILGALPNEYFDRISSIKIEYEIVDTDEPLRSLEKRLSSLGFSVKTVAKSHKQGFLAAKKS